MCRHAQLLVEWVGEDRGVVEFRKHVAWYLKGFAVGGELRSALARASTLAELADLLARPRPERSRSRRRPRPAARPHERWPAASRCPTAGWPAATPATSRWEPSWPTAAADRGQRWRITHVDVPDAGTAVRRAIGRTPSLSHDTQSAAADGARDAQVRLRLRRGQQGSEGPARRQGRQPGRDDQSRPARAARVHDHDRGVPGLPASPAASRASWRTRSPSTSRRSRRRWARSSGQSDDPLLVSVRSGAKFSMPGMMETVLNIGLNDQSVRGLAAQAGNERFAFDSYRRLIQMFGKTVLGIDGRALRGGARRGQGRQGHHERPRPRRRRPAAAGRDVQGRSSSSRPGRPFPQDPREQMDLAVRAVFDSWNTERAVIYRRQERIPTDLGTAVNICSMVFGNLGMDSGTGVAFTRDPASGAQGVYGDYLQNAQGEDVVAGIRNTVPLADLEGIDKKSYDQLMAIMADAGGALPRPVRHRVHHRARQAVDAADPRRQAHRRRGVPDRDPARRPGPDRHGRGGARASPARSWRS